MTDKTMPSEIWAKPPVGKTKIIPAYAETAGVDVGHEILGANGILMNGTNITLLK